MNFGELMKWEGYIYLEKLLEPEDNSLRLLINRSRIDNESEDIEHLPMVQLDFESYISYSVINESFDRIDEKEKSKGKIFRIYTKSNYLDFIKLATNERDDICPFENYVHYQFPCLNHTIDVISFDKPGITVVTG
ncbi:hypothetical protein [Sporosarcina sp. HYO08]|uniref:hypothetical protein n=1 Tax=Sporosarcina sp. HYO08 TaxID=1759557 RepID=UPI0007947087|nr:hypothetical protein [Sporosarcina sp. HYO08]KXH87583.1 hypothetical protein AU377_02565 [Sporosarcina sp. HYO08]